MMHTRNGFFFKIYILVWKIVIALNVFKDVEYCVCMQHVFKNLKKSFRDSLIDRFYFSCAKTYTFDDFEFNIRYMEFIYPNILSYLSNIGFNRCFQAYSRIRRYKMMTTNPLESVNSILKENKNLHVASLIDGIREFLQKWFHDRRKASLSMETSCTHLVNILQCSNLKY